MFLFGKKNTNNGKTNLTPFVCVQEKECWAKRFALKPTDCDVSGINGQIDWVLLGRPNITEMKIRIDQTSIWNFYCELYNIEYTGDFTLTLSDGEREETFALGSIKYPDEHEIEHGYLLRDIDDNDFGSCHLYFNKKENKKESTRYCAYNTLQL